MHTILRRRKLGKTSCDAIVAKTNNNFRVVRNDQGEPDVNDLVFRWGCTSNIPGNRVVNTARAIHQVNDKLGFRRLLEDTELCPKTFFNQEDWIINTEEYPEVIVRPAKHAQGRNLLHIIFEETTLEQLNTFTRQHPEYYISEYIPKVAEYRVFVVSGRAIALAQKTPGNPEDIAWNVARGGRFDNVRWDEWPHRVVIAAIQAFNHTELDFGGVDVMVDNMGRPYVIEINSAPSLTSDYRQSCMAKAFDWIVDHGKERMAINEQGQDYKNFIHPAVCERART